jgi:hypothetical protein
MTMAAAWSSARHGLPMEPAAADRLPVTIPLFVPPQRQSGRLAFEVGDISYGYGGEFNPCRLAWAFGEQDPTRGENAWHGVEARSASAQVSCAIAGPELAADEGRPVFDR